jgi:hypothetical protein
MGGCFFGTFAYITRARCGEGGNFVSVGKTDIGGKPDIHTFEMWPLAINSLALS